jgi:hypothetical protein
MTAIRRAVSLRPAAMLLCVLSAAPTAWLVPP